MKLRYITSESDLYIKDVNSYCHLSFYCICIWLVFKGLNYMGYKCYSLHYSVLNFLNVTFLATIMWHEMSLVLSSIWSFHESVSSELIWIFFLLDLLARYLMIDQFVLVKDLDILWKFLIFWWLTFLTWVKEIPLLFLLTFPNCVLFFIIWARITVLADAIANWPASSCLKI